MNKTREMRGSGVQPSHQSLIKAPLGIVKQHKQEKPSSGTVIRRTEQRKESRGGTVRMPQTQETTPPPSAAWLRLRVLRPPHCSAARIQEAGSCSGGRQESPKFKSGEWL